MTQLPGHLRFASQGDWDALLQILRSDSSVASDVRQLSRWLHDLAAFPASAPVLQKLIELGADLNYHAYGGGTVLANAIVGGSLRGLTTLPELRLLLQSGADVSKYADAGYPPLHWAIVQNRLEHARLLLQAGSDPEQTSADGETALDVAKRNRNASAIEMLEAHRQLQSS